MARPESAEPVKLLAAILRSPCCPIEDVQQILIRAWGEIDYAGPDRPFDMTDYYEAEMGPGLQRRLVSFAVLAPPESIVAAKHACNEIEDRLASAGGRTVNLDIGYLDHNKIVLASFKGAGQKIYLGEGVWADMAARYKNGKYLPFEWTFPDFRDGRYDEELSKIRRIYLNRLREERRKGNYELR